MKKSRYASYGFKGKKHTEEYKIGMKQKIKQLYLDGKKMGFVKGKDLRDKKTKKEVKLWHKHLSKAHKGQIPWNKDLTKETDDRVKQYTEKSKLTKKLHPQKVSLKTRKKISKFFRERYEKNPELHPNKRMRKNNYVSQWQNRLYSCIKAIYPSRKVILEYPIKVNKYNKFLDIAIPELKLNFEYDGKYWHRDKSRDRLRDKQLKELGWKIYRFDVDGLIHMEEMIERGLVSKNLNNLPDYTVKEIKK